MRETSTTHSEAPGQRPAPDGQAPAGDIERLAALIGGGALMLYGLRRSPGRLALAALGGALAYAGATGRARPVSALLSSITGGARGHGDSIHIVKSVTVNVTPERLYEFWCSLDNLPRIMRHLEEVREIDDTRSHWVARGPAGATIEWDAEITQDRENAMIEWRSLPGSMVTHTGSVSFRPTAGNRGTEVHVTLDYRPPAGALGHAVAKLFGGAPDQQIAEDLRRFKQLMETGQLTTTDGQPSARAETHVEHEPATAEREAARRKDKVQRASEQSFPASDPPTWTTGRASGERDEEETR